MLKEFLLEIVIPTVLVAAAVFGVPVGAIYAYQHAWEQGNHTGIKQERAKLIERDMGRYAFSAETGKPVFVYGKVGGFGWYFEAK